MQCGTVITGGDCAVCAGAGKKEVITMVAMLLLIFVVLAIYATLKVV